MSWIVYVLCKSRRVSRSRREAIKVQGDDPV